MSARHGLVDQEISEPIAAVVPLRPGQPDLTALVDDWLAEYTNARTQERYGVSIRLIARCIGATAPADFTPAAVMTWARSYDRANNTMRGHITAVRMFLRWCHETGNLHQYRDKPFQRLLRSYPATYGKVEGHRPPRRLSEAEYRTLLVACQDGTDSGLRDELLIRLGVTGGMRVTELLNLAVGTIRRAPDLSWLGKANKPRTAQAGPELVAVIREYLTRYAAGSGDDPHDDAPVFCPAQHSRRAHLLRWGSGITTAAGLRLLLARRVRTAGLGYMAPHDLKRTAARIMHDARSDDGGHLFDLLDIADVLDHSNPKVTKDCYIGPLGNDNKARAAALFG